MTSSVVVDGAELSPASAAKGLAEFFVLVDNAEERVRPGSMQAAYHKAAVQASNDRSNRILRGEIIRGILAKAIVR
jgi:hypothetical protein